MLNRNFRWAICLLIGIFLSIGSVSFAHEFGCSNSWQACVDGWTAPDCSVASGYTCWAQ